MYFMAQNFQVLRSRKSKVNVFVQRLLHSIFDFLLLLSRFRSEISDAIGDALGIDFARKRLRLGDIKNILAESKK